MSPASEGGSEPVPLRSVHRLASVLTRPHAGRRRETSPSLSYAQRFEDFHLWRALGDVPNGFYVDVGAGHPVFDNVSFAFYLAGWRGITVEPNPALAALARAVRPRDHLYEGLCGAAAGRSDALPAARISRPLDHRSRSTRRPPRRKSTAAPKP